MKEYRTKNGTRVYEYEREDLEKLSTRQLISIVHCSENKTFINDGKHFEFEYGDDWTHICEESVIRDILKNRPHIPNREERRKLINSAKKNTKKNLEYRK